MKVKTIEKILNSKFDAFVKSISDKNVAELVKDNTIISGGCIASMLLDEEVNDFDIYFTNKATCLAVAEYYVKEYLKNNDKSIPIEVVDVDDRVLIMVKSAGISSIKSKDEDYRYFEQPTPGSEQQENFFENVLSYAKFATTKKDYKPVFLTSNAVTLKGGIQLVFRFYGDHKEIHKNFDYVHATNYWVSKEKKIYTNKKALECLINKELRYIGSLYPLCSIFRLRKFIKRGFQINAGQLFKIMWQISKLNLSDPSVLIDQLMGVDVYYMYDLINKLGCKSDDVDYIYICKIIDEIF